MNSLYLAQLYLEECFYTSEFSHRVSEWVRDIIPWLENISNTITLPPPNFTFFFVYFTLKHLYTSLNVVLTIISKQIKLAFIIENTLAQFSYIHITYLIANSNFFFLFFKLKSGFFCQLCVNKPTFFSHLVTVCFDTLFVLHMLCVTHVSFISYISLSSFSDVLHRPAMQPVSL